MKESWYVRWFRRRALLYHLFVLILAPGCLWAGWWQIHRAMAGNTLSYLYSVEWPIFAIMSVVGWWQLIHEDPAAVESRKVERARRAANRGPFVPPPPDTESGFYHPLPSGSPGALRAAGANGGQLQPGWDGVVDSNRSDALGEPVAVHALSSYNAYLARLSAGGGRKSWRNPRGETAAMEAEAHPPIAAGPPTPEVGLSPPRERIFVSSRHESALVETTSVQPSPLQPTRAQPTPGQATPGQPVPVGPAADAASPSSVAINVDGPVTDTSSPSEPAALSEPGAGAPWAG